MVSHLLRATLWFCISAELPIAFNAWVLTTWPGRGLEALRIGRTSGLLHVGGACAVVYLGTARVWCGISEGLKR